jgi:predicted RND superfamily exporter protein
MFFVLIVSIVMIGFNTQIKFNYDFEDFFQEEDENVTFYQEFREQFEDDSQFLLIGIKSKNTVFDSLFLSKVDALSQKIKNDSNIHKVYSPTRLKKYFIGPMGGFRSPILNYKDPSVYSIDSAYIYQSPQLVEAFFAPDGQSLAVTIKANEGLDRVGTRQLIKSLRAACEEQCFFEYHIAGKLIAQETYIDKTQVELLTFASVSLVLIVFFLFLTYRSFWLLIIPLVVVMLSVIWSTGAMAIGGKDLDLLTSLLPSIMFVVGVSDVIHFFSKYLEELGKGVNKNDAISKTVNEVGKATLLTSVTTAIGFFTLYFIDIKPIRDFGLYCGLGVLFAFVITILLLPPLLRLLPEPRQHNFAKTDKFWNRLLGWFLTFVLLKRKSLLVLFALITAVSLMGISKIEINTKLIDDLRDDDPMKLDFVFFEEHFSGVRPFELAVNLQDNVDSFLDKEVLVELDKITDYLHGTYGVKSILGPGSMVKGVNQALHGGLPEYYILPTTIRGFTKTKVMVEKNRKREGYKMLINDEKRLGRITGKVSDIGSQEIESKNETLRQFLTNNIDPSVIKVRITGSALLIDENNTDLSENMMIGLIVAFGSIALIMGFLFRSYKMILISLIPNIIPLCMLGGILGFFEVDLKLSTSIIFTVAFGIAVDDTIHFMSRYKMEREKGKSMLYAIKRTFISTGKALIITSFILSSGFMSLMLSSFMGTFYTGLFISLTLLFALLTDLMLLPVLLLFIEKKR